jgi:preprotein translocase subunit YajC
MLEQMKRGDRVQTIGGILGKVVEAEPEKVLLKVDESSNTKIWFSRNAIHRVLTDEKVETKS